LVSIPTFKILQTLFLLCTQNFEGHNTIQLPSGDKTVFCLYIYIYTHKVFQEESAVLRYSVPYVNLHRYNKETYIQSWSVTEIVTGKIVIFLWFHILYLRKMIYWYTAQVRPW